MRLNSKKSICIKSKKKREIHRAGWIMVDAFTFIENGYLEIENGFIYSANKGRPKEKSIDHGPGVLIPPLVNAHLHLELSALKNQLPFDRGFKSWVKMLLEKRDAMGEEILMKEAQISAHDLFEWGNLYVGEISTLGITRQIIEESALNGVFFHEFLGSDIPKVLAQKNESVSFSVAGHAPHTSSPQLLKALKKRAASQDLPFSIHLAESDDETEFICDQKGEWANFMTLRGIDFSSWDIGSKTPVSYIKDLGLLDSSTLAVHLLNVNEKDMDILTRSKTKTCVCPRSNWNLHKKLPDIETMIQKGIHPALGTDSLASCDSLNVLDEMAFVQKHYPNLDPCTIVAMGTINGARALGVEHMTGTLSKGKKAQFLYRPLAGLNNKNILQRIISNE
jgi:aminodeoxyfutalosine deaminase